MFTRTLVASLTVAALLLLALPARAAEESLKDRIFEDVKTRRIHSTEGETPEKDRPIIKGDRALDPETGDELEAIILRAEPVAGALKYASFYSKSRKVYWAFVWGGPRNVRIIHGPFKLSTVTMAMVEKALQKLITPEGNVGFYEGQFNELVKMGKGVTPFLLEIFRNETRPHPLRSLSIDAFGEIQDKSVIPKLREFYENEDYAPFRSSIVFTLAKLGDMHYANQLINSYREYIQKNPDNPQAQAEGYSALAHAYARLEKQEEAIDCYKKAIDLNPENAYIHYYNMACAYSVMKRVEEGLEALKKAIDNGYDDHDWMMLDGDLNNLRKDPRFKKLVERIKGK